MRTVLLGNEKVRGSEKIEILFMSIPCLLKRPPVVVLLNGVVVMEKEEQVLPLFPWNHHNGCKRFPPSILHMTELRTCQASVEQSGALGQFSAN